MWVHINFEIRLVLSGTIVCICMGNTLWFLRCWLACNASILISTHLYTPRNKNTWSKAEEDETIFMESYHLQLDENNFGFGSSKYTCIYSSYPCYWLNLNNKIMSTPHKLLILHYTVFNSVWRMKKWSKNMMQALEIMRLHMNSD